MKKFVHEGARRNTKGNKGREAQKAQTIDNSKEERT
jgi:hypothetical protein